MLLLPNRANFVALTLDLWGSQFKVSIRVDGHNERLEESPQQLAFEDQQKYFESTGYNDSLFEHLVNFHFSLSLN